MSRFQRRESRIAGRRSHCMTTHRDRGHLCQLGIDDIGDAQAGRRHRDPRCITYGDAGYRRTRRRRSSHHDRETEISGNCPPRHAAPRRPRRSAPVTAWHWRAASTRCGLVRPSWTQARMPAGGCRSCRRRIANAIRGRCPFEAALRQTAQLAAAVDRNDRRRGCGCPAGRKQPRSGCVSRSSRVSATTSVALCRSASGRRSSARWALASWMVCGPAP